MSLFNFSKKITCPVTDEDKKYVEQILQRLILHFGYDLFMSSVIVTPDHEIYKSKNLTELVLRINKILNLDVDFETNIFDDHQSSTWLGVSPAGTFREEKCLLEISKENDRKKIKISVAKSLMTRFEKAISEIAENLCLEKLNEAKFYSYKNDSVVYLKKISSMFFGFGIASTNTTYMVEPEWKSSSPMMLETASYAFALSSWVKKENYSTYEKFLSIDAKPYFKKSFLFLNHTNESLLSEEKLQARLYRKKLYEEAGKFYRENKFDSAIQTCDELLILAPQISSYHNLIGFYKLRVNKYEESIAHLKKAISISHEAYYYNNMGYALIMTNDLENAYKNFMTSMEMDQKNSFLYRNLGIYFTRSGDYNTAKINFEKALEIDPKTELIHHFIGLLKLETNNPEEAHREFQLSAKAGEPESINKLNDLARADNNF